MIAPVIQLATSTESIENPLADLLARQAHTIDYQLTNI